MKRAIYFSVLEFEVSLEVGAWNLEFKL